MFERVRDEIVYVHLNHSVGQHLFAIHDEYLCNIIHQRPTMVFFGPPDRLKSFSVRLLEGLYGPDGEKVLSRIGSTPGILKKLVGKLNIPVGLHDLDKDVLHEMIMTSFDRLCSGNLFEQFDPQFACVVSIKTTVLQQLIGSNNKKQDDRQ